MNDQIAPKWYGAVPFDPGLTQGGVGWPQKNA